jgi:hypothetical protein
VQVRYKTLARTNALPPEAKLRVNGCRRSATQGTN